MEEDMKSTIFAGAVTAGTSGLFRRVSGQTEWECIGNGLPERIRVYCIVMEGDDPQHLLIGSQYGVFRSSDGGDSWADLGVPADERPILSLVVHPNDPATIYAGSDYTSIFKTTDGGATWRRLNTVQPAGAITGCFPVRVLKMAIDPSNPNEIYGALEVGGVIRSLDDGETWEDISRGILKLSEEPHLSNCILSDDLSRDLDDWEKGD